MRGLKDLQSGFETAFVDQRINSNLASVIDLILFRTTGLFAIVRLLYDCKQGEMAVCSGHL